MSGMKADGVLYLAAEFIDTFKEINKQVSKGAIEVAKNNQIKLSVDEKSILASIDETLGKKKLSGFDLSGIVSSRLKQFSELDPNDTFGRKNTLDDLNFDLSLLNRVNLSAIKKNNLKDMSADDITSAIEEVRTLMFKDNSPFDNPANSPAKLITEIFLKNASNIKADIRKQLLEEFGEDVSKYGVSEKEANERLSNIYDSLTRRAEKQFELEGGKNKVTLEDVATENDITKIQGFYTRLKSLGSTISGKSKILGDMLENMFDDEGNIYNVEEEASDTILELGNDLRAYAEREKNLYKRLTASNRDKIKPELNPENIIVDDEDVSDLKENNILQNKQNQEKGKLLEQSKEVLQVETDTANVNKEQTQEIEKQKKLLQEKKQTEKSDFSLKKDTNQKKTTQQQKNNSESSQSKTESNKEPIKGMEDLFDLMQELGLTAQEQTNEIKEEKEQTKQVVQEKKKAVKETKKEVQTQQQTTNELKKQKDLKESSTNIKKDDKTSELQATKEIKEETQQIVEQQKQIVEAKEKTLEVTQKNLKAEQQISAEVKEEENTEEQKPKIMLVHKGKKLPNVQKHGKSQAEIDAQIKAEKEKKEKKTPIVKSDLGEKQKAEAAAAADSEKAKAEEIENLNYIANLNKKLAEAEAEQAKKEAQKIKVTSEQMQKLKQGIQEATDSLKEYKEVDDKIIQAQTNKDAYVISQQTQNEMLQAGVLSSSVDMAEYIRSAYRVYKKTGNKADEDILKEALRQYMLPVGKKKYTDILADENGNYVKDESGNYKTITKIGNAYRDTNYLFSKNGKELKAYTKNKDYIAYIKQAQEEKAAYEKAQRKLPALLEQKQGNQQSFTEASIKIQQLLQEVGLDADKVNEILATINGNLTNEEAIWKVINSYIKEANAELENQQNISENTTSSLTDSSTVQKKSSGSSLTHKSPPTNTEIVEQSKTASTDKINNEANSFDLITVSAKDAAEAKLNFVAANKEVKQSAEKSVEVVDKEDKTLKNITKAKVKNKPNDKVQTEEDAKIKLESKYARLTKQKDFIQDNDISQKFLTKYSDIEATEDIQFYIETATKLGQVKNELKNYFDADNVLIDNNKLDEASSALSYYYELLENLRELKLKITGESSKENVLFESFTEQKAADLAVQQYKDNLEKSFQKIRGSKNYIQGNDTSQEFLTKYSDIEATDKMQEYVKNSLLIAQTKNQLSEYFDKEGNFTKKAYDKNGDLSDEIKQAQELLDLYNRLINAKEKLELEITSNSSQETIRSLSVKAEQELKANVEKDYKKLLQSKEYIQNNLEQRKFIDKYNDVTSTNRTNQFNEALLKQSNIKDVLDKQFDETGALIGDPDEVQKLLKEYNELSNLIQRLKLAIVADNSEETIALKISQDAQKAKTSLENLRQTVTNTFSKISGSKEFIQGNDINDDFLKKYEDISKGSDKGYKATSNLRELKNLGDELANVKTKLKVSFDDAGNLKSSANPLEVQNLLNKYDQLTDKVERLKLLISSPSSQESFLLKEFEQSSKAAEQLEVKVKNSLNKIFTNKNFMSGKDVDITSLDEYFKIGTSENLDRVRSTVEEINFLKQQLAASKDDNGNIIGNPAQVAELVDRYNNLTNVLKSLIDQIRLPNSAETIGLKIAKDAEKAKEELDKLKEKVDTVLGKSNLFEAQTLKTAYTYGVYGGDGEGQRGDLIASNSELLPKDLVAQQKQVEELINKLKEYRIAVAELQNLRTSDDVTLDQLEQANDKVKTLKDSITVLSQTIRTSGVANASKEQVDKLKSSFELFLSKNQNLTEPVRDQIEKYIEVLSSGATVSKAKYNSMIADLNKFNAAQTRGTTIWDQMVGKMREGIAFLATKFSFYQIFNQFRQGITIVKEFDDALTEMQKVSDETMLTLQRYQKTTFDVAESIGSTALQVQQSTADFLRLGESLEEAAKSAKAANVLMNVSEFESINDATTSLIALSAAYDDLTKENIIDKLNEVGNNYSISTSGAAEALQMSASALKTAQNDMNEALALVTAGNQVVQDISKAGNGLRTIALRLTGTKSAKEELEEMGEETENVITTQSKLRDVIKEATAVESNAFKGFDILNDNGNYKSTYEIMLGIAQIYDEIVETDKKLGRNNVNLLLETVAGKTRANVAASIFQSPDILQKAYASSIAANGSAQEENQKYLESISGHLAQLQSKWQEVWSKTANREIINFFIDLGKGILEVVDKIGLIPSALMVLVPYFEIIRTGATNSKGFITILLEALSTLNEVEEASNVIKAESETISLLRAASTQVENEALRQQIEACIEAAVAEEAKNTVGKESTALSLLKKASLEVENAELKEAIDNYIKLAEAEGLEAGVANSAAGSKGVGLLANKFDLLKRAASGLKTAIVGLLGETGAMLAALGVGAVAIAGIAVAVNNHMREEAIANAQEVTESLNKQDESLQKQIDSYEELKTKLDSGDLSEKETLETKQQIYDIQKQITEEYGTAAQGVDLVNGKLEEQVSLLNTINQKEAQTMYSQNYEGFEAAIDEYTKDRKYGFSLSSPSKEIQDALSAAGMQVYGSGSGTFMAQIKDDATNSIESLEKAKVNLEELKEQYKNTETEGIIDNEIRKIDKAIGEAYEDADEYKDTALRGLELRLLSRDQNGYNVFENYQSSVSDLENAYISGDTKKIEEARKAFEEATIVKNKFLSIPSNNQFSLLFDNIDTSLIKTKNQIYDATEAVKKAKEINTELDRINNYKEQKKQADAFYNSLGNLQKVGNIDNGNRPIIFWNNEELKEQQKAIESWGETIEDFKGSMSTVYGGSGSFDGVEIAFTPIINDGTGKGKLLTKETLYKYIDTLIGNAGEGWTNESLLKLDAEGLVIDGQKISNVLGAVGNSMSNVGLTAVQVGEMMHDWQSSSLGYISEFKNEWQEAIEQGESLEEHMQNREKDLLGTSKATDKYTKNEIKLAKALREVTRLDIDRVDAEMVFDENAKSSETYRNALYNLMDALGWASDAHASFIDWAVDVGLIQGTVTDALNAASVSYNDYASAVATAIENLELLQTVLTESDSGKGLSITTLDQFKEAFGDDAVLALEKTANGIRANRDAIRELGAQQDESLRTTQLQALNDQYTALQKVYEGYENALHNGDPTTPFIQQEEAIRNEINNLELLQAEWRGTTSAYQAWLNAQSNSNPQDMYANVISGYETVEDLIARGWWTDESVRNYLDLVLADDFDAQIAGANELKEGFESLDKTIEGTSFSIHDFFMTDESGNIVVDGLNNFEDALKQVQDKYYPDKNWLTYEDGNAIFDFRNGGNKEVADALGIGTELLDIIISAMESAGGFEVKLDTDDAKENLKQLKEEAIDAKESLDLNEKINLDPSNIKEADESISNINTVIEEIKNNDEIDLEAKTDQLEEANRILEYLIENKNQLIQSSFGEKGIHLIDIGELDAVNNKLKEILNRPVKGGFDFSEFDFDTVEGLTAAQDAINDMLVAPNVDNSQIQYLNELLDVITEKLGIINGIGSGASLTLGEYKALDETVTSVKQQIQEGQDAANKGFHISWSSDEDFYNTLDAINNLDPEIKTAFGLIPDKTTEELMDMVENGETIFVETKTTGVTPPPVQDETRTITTQENVKLGVTTVGAEPAQELIQDLNIHDGQEFNMYMEAHANTEEANNELDKTIAKGEEAGNLQPEAEVTADNSQANNAIDEAARKMSEFNGTTSWGHIRIDAGNSVNIIDSLTQGIKDIPTYKKTVIETVEKTTKAGKANGTAHVQGTAFAKGSIVSGNAFIGGKWGIPQNQTALTGELGTEIVVRDGNWFTVGEDGAEFVDLQKGDIVFNHKQAQELLENGYVTSNKGRGKLVGFANGSAFYRGTMLSGPAYGGDSAKRTRTTSSVTTKKVGKKTTKGTTTGKGSGGGGGGKGNGGGGGTTNKEANKTKNTLDEVEILIARIERQIANLDKTISSTYKTWSTRNAAIKNDLTKVAKEIKEQSKAYTTYMRKANSIQIATDKNADGSTKSAKDKKKQSDTWKKRIQNGQQIIRDISNQDVWDKIQEYKQW